MIKSDNHLAIRWNSQSLTLCGLRMDDLNVYWADAVSAIKKNSEYKGIKFCEQCLMIKKKRKIKQLTAEECKKA